MRVWDIVSGGTISALLFFGFRWFLLKTDVFVGYNWSWKGTDYYPNFDIRNLSGSKTYVLANIAYTKNKGKEIVILDNKSIWGRELKPGTITHLSAATVPTLSSLRECLTVEVRIRLQNGREFKGEGPGQLYKGLRKFGFAVRQRMEKASLPLP